MKTDSNEDTLSATELFEATKKRRAASQAAVLARLGVPFEFSGRSVTVDRTVAMAHALLPRDAPPAPPTPLVEPHRVNPGLEAWRASRAVDPKLTAYIKQINDAYRAGAPERRRVVRSANRAKRRADQMRRTPAWANQEAIKEVYAEARRLTQKTGIPHHVDHEIPLRGTLVSGLHVHNNLRAIPCDENIRKGNKFDGAGED